MGYYNDLSLSTTNDDARQDRADGITPPRRAVSAAQSRVVVTLRRDGREQLTCRCAGERFPHRLGSTVGCEEDREARWAAAERWHISDEYEPRYAEAA